MMIKLFSIFAFCFSVTLLFAAQTSYAQHNSYNKQGPSKISVDYARRVAPACTGGKWETQPCLKAVSESNLAFASNYIKTLRQRGKGQGGEKIKEHCAASTAASQGESPAYAMRSAFVECANMVFDVSEQTGVLPDQSHYQLLVSAVQCLDKSQACKAIETGLAAYKR
jgi:hypothetical protein